MIFLLAAPVFAAPAEGYAPSALKTIPGGRQSLEEPMKILAEGVSGTPAWGFILRDCNHDYYPDSKTIGDCKTPAHQFEWKFGPEGRLREYLDLRNYPELPKSVPLWLRVCSKPDPIDSCREALFSVAGEPCALLDTLLHSFGAGPCSLSLEAAFGQRRAYASLPEGKFIVELFDDPLDGNSKPRKISGTSGASGVAWLNKETLLVTRAQDPGLYRVEDSPSARPQLLWRAPAGATPLAPFALSTERWLVVLERRNSGKQTWELIELEKGKVKSRSALGARIHKIHRADSTAKRILAEGTAGGDLELFVVEIANGHMTGLGYSAGALYPLTKSPSGELAALAYENSGDGGWDIDLLDSSAKLRRRLCAREADDWMPAWSPNGKLAYLAAE